MVRTVGRLIEAGTYDVQLIKARRAIGRPGL